VYESLLGYVAPPPSAVQKGTQNVYENHVAPPPSAEHSVRATGIAGV